MNAIEVMTKETGKARLMRHVIFWSVFFLLDLLKYQLISSDDLIVGVVFNICALLPQVIFTYIVCYGIIPIFIDKKSRLLAILLFLITSYVFAVINRLMIVHVAEELMAPLNEQEPVLEILTDWRFLLKRYMPSNWWVALVFIFVKYFVDKDRLLKKELGIEKQQVESELKTLKAQLNPHFLFNTLNNIYSLSVAQSPKTSDAIAKLSDMLDQILYRSNDKLVALKDEMHLIDNYIELEQLRYNERLDLSLKTDIEEDVSVPPLILLSLVENAFKHGAAEDDGSPDIDISVKSNSKGLQFLISNSVVEKKEKIDRETIGLQNIRKQLDLLYGNSYGLRIEQTENRYSVELEIKKP